MRYAKTISRYPLRLLRFALDVAAADTDYSPRLREVVFNHLITHNSDADEAVRRLTIFWYPSEAAAAQPRQHQR